MDGDSVGYMALSGYHHPRMFCGSVASVIFYPVQVVGDNVGIPAPFMPLHRTVIVPVLLLPEKRKDLLLPDDYSSWWG